VSYLDSSQPYLHEQLSAGYRFMVSRPVTADYGKSVFVYAKGAGKVNAAVYFAHPCRLFF
jgi:hypothetical protein